jgi:hypothetical protein
MTETLQTRDHRIHAISRDEARLELRDGKLLVTRLDGVIIEFEQQESVEAV